jgi:Transposase IS116/IS110/IS902 family
VDSPLVSPREVRVGTARGTKTTLSERPRPYRRASSGRQQRHRLNCKGNRQLNLALHRIAVIQARMHPPARAYLERKRAEGRSRREALRCLKRHLARVIFRLLRAIAQGAPKVERLPIFAV